MRSAKTRMGNVSTVYSYFLIGLCRASLADCMHIAVCTHIFHEKGFSVQHQYATTTHVLPSTGRQNYLLQTLTFGPSFALVK